MGGARIFDVQGSLAAKPRFGEQSKSIPMNVQKVSENVGCDGF